MKPYPPPSLRPMVFASARARGQLSPAGRFWRVMGMLVPIAVAFAASAPTPGRAEGHSNASENPASATPDAAPAPTTGAPKSIKEQLREAIKNGVSAEQRLQLVIQSKKVLTPPPPATASAEPAKTPSKGAAPRSSEPLASTVAVKPAPPVDPKASRKYIRARAAALSGQELPAAPPKKAHDGEVHWSYTGETGPQAWGKLKPEFASCATGKRQSPINIDEPNTLQGPAEPLVFNYTPSGGSVINNGHTIQVDLQGENSLSVRGTRYKLVQFHFHTPSEERVNNRSSAMVAHLVHKNAGDELAVVSVLLEPGQANTLIDKVWTHMPLDAGDRVPLPAGLIDMNELLPKDQRYYQYLGSLTTPPCTEGVLWMVFKQATPVSSAQIRLFSQIFPNNARPVQPVHDRIVRNAQ